MMGLQVLVSKKGTKVVTASNLYQMLELPAHAYNRQLKHWLTDVYNFKDGVREPIELKDYALRERPQNPFKDFYLSVELAKLVALNTHSKHKGEIARYLQSHEIQVVDSEKLTKEQVIAVLELTKVMGLMSCQKSVEEYHQRLFNADDERYSNKWWQYRAGMLGYSVETLRSKMQEIGKTYRGKNLIQMLMHLDKYEIIRMAVIDLFIGLGKTREYAKNMGDLAKFFAEELKVEIWDDRKATIGFEQSKVNVALVQEVKNLERGAVLSLW